ncbi:MAG: assimilatory sulfite reductase (NADPH) flavoprotein subunit [Marinicellaceae bacterium]
MYSKNQAISPLAPEQLNKVNLAVQDLDANQLLWVSGFIAGLSGQHKTETKINPSSQLTILYGSQTGNGKRLAQDYSQKCESLNINCQLISLADYKPRNIIKEQYIVMIVSTHGEGDAPDDAEIFYEYLFSKKAPKLENLKYSLLALGDSSYEKFCQTGVDIDLQLQKLGATPVVNRIDCDLEYEDSFSIWQEKTHDYFSSNIKSTESNVTSLSLLKPQKTSQFNRNITYSSEILTIQRITSDASVKNVCHIELDIEGSNIQYNTGDSVGIVVKNSHESVDALIHSGGFNSNKTITYKNNKLLFKDQLRSLEITLLSKTFLRFYASLLESDSFTEIIDNHTVFQDFVQTRQLSDVLREYPTLIEEQQLVDNLNKISPRLYSIASSQIKNPDEVHLTIALVESKTIHPNTGLVSGLLCEQLKEGDSVEIYVEENNNFKLPENNDVPIIMIGAGTGIAPFRGFLQERRDLKATGENWLFFGNPSFDNDFLYQLELQKYHKENLLTQIDLAWSRDQKNKIYVQNKVKQKAAEIWQWLEKGAHLYICGNKDQMAKSVENELISLIKKYGKMNTENAKKHLTHLKRTKRYQKDVY